MLGLLIIIASLASLVCSIIVIIDAFRDEVWKGLLAIFVPFYLLYYAIVDFDHEYKWPIVGGICASTVAWVIMRLI